MSNKLDFEPRWFIIIVFFIAGGFAGALGLFIWFFNSNSLINIQKVHPASSQYKYINPLLAIDVASKKEFFENLTLSNKVYGLINTYKNDKRIKEAAFYTQDLERGHWTGNNEDLKFSPGKFLRMPIMMAYF